VLIRTMREQGQDVESEAAAALGPVFVLFGQGGADEADCGGAVGEDPDHVGASADFAVEPFDSSMSGKPGDVSPWRASKVRRSGGRRSA
jgi:hypothetical protein